MYPKEITILTKRLKLVDTPNQFRKEDGKRRIGVEYWVAALLEHGEYSPLQGDAEGRGVLILIQYMLTPATDTRWLVDMVASGRVYLTEDTHLLTMAVAKTLKS